MYLCYTNLHEFVYLCYNTPMITRTYHKLEDYLQPGRVLVLYGPRRVGKTTLIQEFLARTTLKYRADIGDDLPTAKILGSRDVKRILQHVENLELYVIDEAQLIPGIGMGLKILADQRPDLCVIATGSSSFSLSQSIGQPLVGRAKTLILYPISQQELLPTYLNAADLRSHLEEFLIYGSYPSVATTTSLDAKRDYLDELTGSYLLQDILALEQIKSPITLVNLLKLLAFQIGSEVSLNELANKLDINVRTVGRYLDLLEKSFVIARLGPFGRNLRSEVTQKSKYYFLDNGVRNSVIAQFNSLTMRNDVGQLWENFLFVERLKHRSCTPIRNQAYFWRTYQGKEIDFLEEGDGKMAGYEVKWSINTEPKAPKDWRTAYPEATFEVVNPDNYLGFITDAPTRV